VCVCKSNNIVVLVMQMMELEKLFGDINQQQAALLSFSFSSAFSLTTLMISF